MFDNYYFEALILKRHSLRKVELLQLIDELMQRKSDIYNQLKIKEKQLERLEKQLKIAVEQLKDTYVICFKNKDTLLHTPEHNIIGGIERDCAIALQHIKDLEK